MTTLKAYPMANCVIAIPCIPLQLYPTPRGNQPPATRIFAYRGTASRSGGSHAGPRRQPRSPSKPSAPKPTSPPSTQKPTSEEEPVEVPSLGWMWQLGRGNGNNSNDPSGSDDVSYRSMPSAGATVANLYNDRIKAKKSLGQNFLTDDSVLSDIVAAAGVTSGDVVLEVGPGTGNLTKHLIARGAVVTAIEKDDTLYGRLHDEYREVPELRIVHGDALKLGLEDILRGMLQQHERPAAPAIHTSPPSSSAADRSSSEHTASYTDKITTSTTTSSSMSTSAMSTLLERPASDQSSSTSTSSSSSSYSGCASNGASSGPGQKVKVVANLPYNITKDLLTLLLPLGDVISDLHIMIQHEAAVRLTEKTPGGPEWRAANIRTLFYCKPKYRFGISRLKYDPVPGVDGALVTFSLRPPESRPSVPSERGFHNLVAKAFSERRKKMRNSLQPLYSSEQVQTALTECGLNPDARAQDLSLEQFVKFSWRLHEAQAAVGRALLFIENEEVAVEETERHEAEGDDV